MRSSHVASRADLRFGIHAEVLPPLALIALTIVSRVPFRSQLLYHWDSVNFAFALDRFDVALGQPHAPGYLLYVLLGHVAAWLAGSAQGGYVLLAIVSSALAAIAIYDLGKRMWSAAVGWWAALLLLFSPLFWFYSEVALPHALDALMVIVAASLNWRVWHGERRMALVLALWLGVAGGLRQQTLVFMLPLALVASIRLPIRWMLGAAAILGVTTLSWLLPLLLISGGPTRYFGIVGAYSAAFDRPTSVLLGAGLSGLQHNLDKLVRYTLWGWALGVVPAVAAAWAFRRQARVDMRNPRLWLLGLWAAPCLAFYTLIHMGQQGLIFVYLPIALLLSARSGVALADRWRWSRWLLLGCVVGNALLFLASPAELLPGRFKVLSLATIREHDALLRDQIAAVRADLPPNAVLIADQWRFPQFYMPDVTLLPWQQSDDDIGTPPATVDPALVERAQQATTLAWYEPTIDRINGAPERTTSMADHGGVQLRVLTRAADERFVITPDGFTVDR